MKKNVCLSVIMTLVFCCFVSGCIKTNQKEKNIIKEEIQEETQQESTTEAPTAPVLEDLSSYSNDVVTWGPGIQTGDDNRPVASVAFQQKYETLWADFLKENEKVIYLTFDEGYENGYTEKILDILKEKEVSAVFFVTMPYAKEQGALIKRMIEENHVIGNHSVTHPAKGMPSLSIEEQLNEYQTLHEYVKNTYQYDMYLFRPPAGIFSEQSLAVAASAGYKTVLWSFAYADWDPDKQPSEAEALKKMEGRIHNGAIYLLHAVSATNTAVLGEFIDYARENGYEFVKYER